MALFLSTWLYCSLHVTRTIRPGQVQFDQIPQKCPSHSLNVTCYNLWCSKKKHFATPKHLHILDVNLPTISLASWAIILLEMLTTIQLFKKPHTAYGIWMLIITFTRACHWSLELQESSPQLSILSFLFPLEFSIKILCAFFISHMCPTCPSHLSLLDLLL
jgi:hypothetical protein